MALLFFLLFLCFLISAFFSSIETAITAINHFQLRHKSLQNYKPAVELEILLQDLNQLIVLILLGNNFVNILAASLTTIIALRLGGEAYVAFASGILTFLILVFAEVLPKTFAASNPEFVAFRVTKILKFLRFALLPIIKFIILVVSLISKVLGLEQKNNKSNTLHLEELRSMLSSNLIHAGEEYQKMLSGILNLRAMKVAHIMRHKGDILGVDVLEPWDEIKRKIIHRPPHSILIVYEDNIDNILGIIKMKSLVVAILKNPDFTLEDFKQLVQKPLFVQMQINLYQLLHIFQSDLQRVAIVSNEYGEVRGIITLNDLFQEIVGEVFDEADFSQQKHEQEDGSCIIDGNMSVYHFFKLFKKNRPDLLEHPVRTVNGLICEYLENLPEKNMTFQYLGLHWVILSVDNYRIKSVQVSQNPL